MAASSENQVWEGYIPRNSNIYFEDVLYLLLQLVIFYCHVCFQGAGVTPPLSGNEAVEDGFSLQTWPFASIFHFHSWKERRTIDRNFCYLLNILGPSPRRCQEENVWCESRKPKSADVVLWLSYVRFPCMLLVTFVKKSRTNNLKHSLTWHEPWNPNFARIITCLVCDPYKPSLSTVSGWGVDPKYTLKNKHGTQKWRFGSDDFSCSIGWFLGSSHFFFGGVSATNTHSFGNPHVSHPNRTSWAY